MPAKRPEIDGIPLPDPAAIERQRRRDQPAHQDNRIQPSVYDIDEGARRQWEEQQRQPEGSSDRGVFIIDMGGGDDDE